MITFACKCTKIYSVDSENAGKCTKCVACGSNLVVPSEWSPPTNAKAVFQALLKAIRESGYALLAVEPQKGQLVFRSRVTLFSFGQEFRLFVTEGQNGTVEVDATSLRRTLFDWGEGYRIIDRVKRDAGVIPPESASIAKRQPWTRWQFVSLCVAAAFLACVILYCLMAYILSNRPLSMGDY